MINLSIRVGFFRSKSGITPLESFKMVREKERDRDREIERDRDR